MTNAACPQAVCSLDGNGPDLFLHPMNIRAIFDDEFHGDTSGPIWLIDSAQNRKWFEQRTDLDPKSALFAAEGYDHEEAALCHMIWGIQDHYPDWEKISVCGFKLTASIRDALRDDGRIAAAEDGFVLHRT